MCNIISITYNNGISQYVILYRKIFNNLIEYFKLYSNIEFYSVWYFITFLFCFYNKYLLISYHSLVIGHVYCLSNKNFYKTYTGLYVICLY